MLTSIQAGVLDVAYQVQGPDAGHPVLLLHGFPYDIHAYAEVADELAAAGCRVHVPFLRGYGATRYLSADTPRSGQQAALAHDVLALLDALGLERATLAGYDWVGRAAGIVAALWPERVAGLVLGDGYPIQDIARAATQPAEPAAELRYWYQYYFHGERRSRRTGETSPRILSTALVAVVTQLALQRRHLRAYRRGLRQPRFRRYRDPLLSPPLRSGPGRSGLCRDRAPARRSATHPRATTVLAGADDGVTAVQDEAGVAQHFSGPFRYEVLPGCGHNIPQEAPAAFAAAVRERLP